jgi:hypothetical protein
MGKSEIDIGEAIARLSALTIFELRDEWRRLHRAAPPMRLSRDLLIRGIAYKLQERAYGELPKSVLRRLAGLADRTAEPTSAVAAALPPLTLKPGTRLVREWHGETHVALIHADGVEWRGRRFASLSVVAKEITGAHWSGPRFFGLRRRQPQVDRVPRDGSPSDEAHDYDER